MQFPRMFHLRQHFDGTHLADVTGAVREELAGLGLASRIRAGETVAITAGSRGIANIAKILRTCVEFLAELRAVPVLIPAMGSHGGATAAGQLGVLAHYGITPERMGCEIRSSMETVVVGTTARGLPIHFDRHAWEADHTLIVNRIKPHTRFTGDIESGLHKMMLIGLGKEAGATVYHRAFADLDFGTILNEAASQILSKCRIVGGLGIIENAYDQTARVVGVRPNEFREREPVLLREAREKMPRLPFADCDLLIIDRIGKNISGAGFDTNIAGRKFDDKQSTPRDLAQVRRIFVRGLTEETDGNATGIGLADFTNSRTVANIDRRMTTINCVTGAHPTAAAIPIHYPSDREAIAAAFQTIGTRTAENAMIMQIANTLEIGEVWASEAYFAEAKANSRFEILSPLQEMRLDAEGNLRGVGE